MAGNTYFPEKTFEELCHSNHYNWWLHWGWFQKIQYVWKNCFKDTFNLGINGDRVEIVLECWIFFCTQNIVFRYILWHKQCGPKSTKKYCSWNPKNCQNLYKISLQNHTFAKFNFAIFYLPPYKQLFGWEKSLSNLDVNKHVLVLTKWLWTSLKILFRTKQLALMTKGTCLFVPEGTNKLKHLSWKKTLSINVWCKKY